MTSAAVSATTAATANNAAQHFERQTRWGSTVSMPMTMTNQFIRMWMMMRYFGQVNTDVYAVRQKERESHNLLINFNFDGSTARKQLIYQKVLKKLTFSFLRPLKRFAGSEIAVVSKWMFVLTVLCQSPKIHGHSCYIRRQRNRPDSLWPMIIYMWTAKKEKRRRSKSSDRNITIQLQKRW